MKKVYDWLTVNKLYLSIYKTKFMIFHFPKCKLKFNINLKITNVPIEELKMRLF